MEPLKVYFLLKMVIFHCYVSLPEGTCKHTWNATFTGWPWLLEEQIFRMLQKNILEKELQNLFSTNRKQTLGVAREFQQKNVCRCFFRGSFCIPPLGTLLEFLPFHPFRFPGFYGFSRSKRLQVCLRGFYVVHVPDTTNTPPEIFR